MPVCRYTRSTGSPGRHGGREIGRTWRLSSAIDFRAGRQQGAGAGEDPDGPVRVTGGNVSRR